MARKYDKKTQQKVGKVMHEYKEGTLAMGKSGKKVKSKKQAIAIGLSQAREAGGKAPADPTKKNRKGRASVLKKKKRAPSASPLKQRNITEKKGSKQRPTSPGRRTKYA